MKIFITGNMGLLGTGFTKYFGDKYEIVGFDHKSGDEVLDYSSLAKKMQGCEMAVHLAAIPKPLMGKTFDDYIQNNVLTTKNVLESATMNGLKRVIFASSTSIYGIEKGIPFASPIKENNAFVSEYLTWDSLKCRDIDLSYHMSKVMAEQILAWYGLSKKIETIALRFGPINKVFLGTSVSMENATSAIDLALRSKNEYWYEPFSIVDDLPHISNEKAKRMLNFSPKDPNYQSDQIHSTFEERAIL